MVFENKFGHSVDSIVFNINNYSSKILKVEESETVYREITTDSINTNTHDVTILASIYYQGKILKNASSYTDLSGSLNRTYTLTLMKDTTAYIK